jgi:hypothetical protein
MKIKKFGKYFSPRSLVSSRRRQFILYLLVSTFVVFLTGINLALTNMAEENEIVLPMSCKEKPVFEDYPIEGIYPARPSSVKFGGVELDTEQKTMIRRAMERGVNFAGKYVIAEWGCGISCQDHIVVDVESGNIVAYGIQSSYGVEYKKNSSLLVVDPVRSDKSNSPISPSYYILLDDTLASVCK